MSSAAISAVQQELSLREEQIKVLTSKFLEQRKKLAKAENELKKSKCEKIQELEYCIESMKEESERKEHNAVAINDAHFAEVEELQKLVKKMIEAEGKMKEEIAALKERVEWLEPAEPTDVCGGFKFGYSEEALCDMFINGMDLYQKEQKKVEELEKEIKELKELVKQLQQGSEATKVEKDEEISDDLMKKVVVDIQQVEMGCARAMTREQANERFKEVVDAAEEALRTSDEEELEENLMRLGQFLDELQELEDAAEEDEANVLKWFAADMKTLEAAQMEKVAKEAKAPEEEGIATEGDEEDAEVKDNKVYVESSLVSKVLNVAGDVMKKVVSDLDEEMEEDDEEDEDEEETDDDETEDEETDDEDTEDDDSEDETSDSEDDDSEADEQADMATLKAAQKMEAGKEAKAPEEEEIATKGDDEKQTEGKEEETIVEEKQPESSLVSKVLNVVGGVINKVVSDLDEEMEEDEEEDEEEEETDEDETEDEKTDDEDTEDETSDDSDDDEDTDSEDETSDSEDDEETEDEEDEEEEEEEQKDEQKVETLYESVKKLLFL